MSHKLGTADLKLLSSMPISIGNKVYDYDPSAFLVFNPNFQNINDILARIPGDFAHWAFLESLARVVAEETEDKRAVFHAKLYYKYEKELSSSETRKPTVDAIKSAICMDIEYQGMLEQVRKANHAVNNLMAMRQAMQQKKDLAMAIAYNLRAEREAHLGDQLKTVRDRIHAARTPSATP